MWKQPHETEIKGKGWKRLSEMDEKYKCVRCGKEMKEKELISTKYGYVCDDCWYYVTDVAVTRTFWIIMIACIILFNIH